MTQTIAHWLLFVLALLFANLPFVSNRIMGILPVTKKGGWTRVIEVIAGYFIVGLVGFAIEGSLSQTTPQRWEFYALTACLFLVFAFPGFVYRFLWRSPKA
ncbi:MAG: DUF2818 family protein [Burkholderiales bacterium]|uniref:DUF2818 family protein n=1 Tax=Limnobacter sp. TaxID=2003368 RepID=UPI0039358EEE|nr:DUF2818 family protein [Burkholderiales bacterium]